MTMQTEGRDEQSNGDSDDSENHVDEESSAKTELRRAYLQLSFAKFDDALASCREAATLAPAHVLPPTLEGAILVAAGRVREAMKHLERVRTKYPDKPLPHVYLAEACLLAGRAEQGLRTLEKADELDESGDHGELIDQLRELWRSLDPGDVPPPLEPVVAQEE